MQLLFLWIETYKNIENQGFNFSPLHQFHFEPSYCTDADGNKVVAGGTLTDQMSAAAHAQQKRVYENFFGEQISNVTAIVGKNGSGKSSIGEFIERALYAADHGSGNLLLVFLKNKKIFYYHSYNNINVSLGKKGQNAVDLKFHDFRLLSDEMRPSALQELLWLRYNSNLMTKSDIRTGVSSKKVIHIHPALWFRYQDTNMKYIINITDQILIRYVKFAKENTIDMLFDAPLEVKLTIISSYKGLGESFDKLIPKETQNELFRQIKETLLEQYRSLFLERPIHKNRNASVFLDHFTHKFLFNIYITLIIRILKSIPMIEKEQILKILNSNDKSLRQKVIAILDINQIDFNAPYLVRLTYEMIKHLDTLVKSEKLHIEFPDESEVTDNDGLKLEISSNASTDDMKLFFNFISTYLDAKIYNFINLDYYKLSQGEKYLLMLYSFIFDNYKDPVVCNETRQVIIFIDEGDVGLHPQWQKKFLHNLLKVLPYIFPNKQIQLILTTHSPFLVSDLPKENIIFLDRDDKGKCQIADLNSKNATLGANIHTLFADSFFMEDGLMGEFAKSKLIELAQKIEQVIEETDSEQINLLQTKIDMIGEPFLREQFQRKLDERAFNSQAIIRQRLRDLEEEKKDLENKLNE